MEVDCSSELRASGLDRCDPAGGLKQCKPGIHGHLHASRLSEPASIRNMLPRYCIMVAQIQVTVIHSEFSCQGRLP